MHCSAVTRAELEANYNGIFSLEERGLVEMKGKGQLTTYWLGGTERNESLNRDALARLDSEVKDLLLKADFKINIGSMEEGEASLCHDTKRTSEEETQPAPPRREFCLPKKTSRVRCSVPSMHDVRRIGSIMRKIKNGGDGPAKNFSWGKKKRPVQRQVKSMSDCDPPSKRNISKLSEEKAVTVAGRLASLDLPQKFRKLDHTGHKVSVHTVSNLTMKSLETTRLSPLGFKTKTATSQNSSGVYSPRVSELSLSSLTTSVPPPEASGDLGAAEQDWMSKRSKMSDLSDDAATVCSEAITGARRISASSPDMEA